MASGTVKLSLLIELQNKLGGSLNSAKKQVQKATGEMQSKFDMFKVKSIESFNNIKSEIPIIGKAFELLKNPIVIVTAAIAGLRAAFRMARSAISEWEAAAEQQIAAETRLTQVMRNTMGASRAETKSILELAAAQQKLGIVGDEIQLSGAQELATYLTKSDSLKKLIPVMNDMLAQQYGYNVSQEQAINIASMMGKVMDGQVGALSRYGYKFDENQEKILKFGTESQRVATLVDVVTASVGGVNAALAATPRGMYKQIQNEMGDLKESAGILFTELKQGWIPVQRAALGFWMKIFDFVQRHKEQIKSVIATIANIVISAINGILTVLKTLRNAFLFLYEWRAVIYGIVAAITILNAKVIAQTVAWVALKGIMALVTAAQWAFNVAASANPIGLIVIAIGALIGGLVVAYNKFDKFRAIMLGTWEVVKGFGNILKDYVIDRIKGLLSGLGSLGQALQKLFKGDFRGAWDDAKKGVADLTGYTAVKNAAQKTAGLKNNFTNKYNEVMTDAERRKQEDGDFNGVPDDENNLTPVTTGNFSDDAKTIADGSKSKVVNITIDSFIKNFTPMHQTIQNMNRDELEQWLTDIFMRLVRSAELMQ